MKDIIQVLMILYCKGPRKGSMKGVIQVLMILYWKSLMKDIIQGLMILLYWKGPIEGFKKQETIVL